MTDKGETRTPKRDAAADRPDQRIAELEAEMEQTKAENARLKARIAQLKERIAQLEQRVAELERAGKRQATPFVMAVLRAALSLRDQKAQLAPEAFAAQAAEIEQRLDALIDEKRRLTDPDNVRLAKRLRKQREHLLRFLYVDDLDATNNHAERMLRPAIIIRKTSGCNRTEGGAEARSILVSVLVTCRQRAISAMDFLVKVQRAAGGATPSLVAAPAVDTSRPGIRDYLLRGWISQKS